MPDYLYEVYLSTILRSKTVHTLLSFGSLFSYKVQDVDGSVLTVAVLLVAGAPVVRKDISNLRVLYSTGSGHSKCRSAIIINTALFTCYTYFWFCLTLTYEYCFPNRDDDDIKRKQQQQIPLLLPDAVRLLHRPFGLKVLVQSMDQR